MFDPNLGRWMQLDPVGLDSGDANLYRFVDNNPVVHTDPLGLKKYESKDGPFGMLTLEVEQLDSSPSEKHMPKDWYPDLNRSNYFYGFWVKISYKPNDKCPCVGGVRFIQIARGFKDGKLDKDWHIDNPIGDSPFYGIDKEGKMPPKFGNGGQNDADGWTYVIDRPNVQFAKVEKTPGGDVKLPYEYHWEYVTVAVCPKTKQIMAAVHFFLPVSKGPGPNFHGRDKDNWWQKWNELTRNEYSQK